MVEAPTGERVVASAFAPAKSAPPASDTTTPAESAAAAGEMPPPSVARASMVRRPSPLLIRSDVRETARSDESAVRLQSLHRGSSARASLEAARESVLRAVHTTEDLWSKAIMAAERARREAMRENALAQQALHQKIAEHAPTVAGTRQT